MGALDKFLNYMKLNDEEGEDGYYDDDYFDEEDEPLDNTPKKKTTSVKEKDISEQTDDKAVKRTLPKVTPMRQSKKIGENGMEYTVIAQILNMPKNIVRLIQKFDFTKKNPKLMYIITGETPISLEDSILVAFLNLIGFDVIFFVPTGYRSVEQYFNGNIIEEHQIGEYKYDMQVPNLNSPSLSNAHRSWRDKIFKRGN